MTESTQPIVAKHRSMGWLSVVTVAMLALSSVTMHPDSAGAVPPSLPVPDGVYLDRPWVEPGGELYVWFVGSTPECGDGDYTNFDFSWTFEGPGGVTALATTGFGFPDFAIAHGVGLVDQITSAPLSLGSSGPVSGDIVVTCTPEGGGTSNTLSMPITIRSTPPATIYNSPTAWTWGYPGSVSEGEVITVSALGFDPGESTTVSIVNYTVVADNFPDVTGAFAGPVTAFADGEGAVTVEVTMPSGWSSDDILELNIAGSESRYLLVTASGEPSNGDPSVSVATTGSAFAQGAVSIAAGGYEAGENVVIGLHSALAPAVKLGSLTANGAGKIAGSLYLPAGLASGDYRVWAGAGSIGFLLLNSALTIGPAPETNRIAGLDRYSTAVAASQRFAPGVDTVYLTSGRAFPDALGAGALAAQIGAPVLLTDPGSLPDSVRAELLRLEPANVIVVGGPAAVSAAVFSTVAGLSFAPEMNRIGGADRYDTNRRLIEDAFEDVSAPIVYIAVGSNFPDALAAGPAAATVNGAVVLVNGSANLLDGPTLALLTDLGVTEVRLVGGTSAISTAIEMQLNGLYPGKVFRLAGVDRYDTAAKIVAGAWSTTVSEVILASGANFPDALAAGALGLPMLTSRQSCIPPVVLAQLGQLQPDDVTLVGGISALTAGVMSFAQC